MTFPTLCTLLPDSDATAPLETAISCARTLGAHLDVACVATPPMMSAGYMGGYDGGVMVAALDETRAHLARTEAEVRKRMAREDIPWTCHATLAGAEGLNTAVRDVARFADLVVLPRPDGKDTQREDLFDAVLFGTDRPVLLPHGADEPLFDRISIAWDSSDQALAAARAALPLLRRAKTVTIVMVDPPRADAGRFAPGECLAALLSRHGIYSDIDLVPRMGQKIATVLSDHAVSAATDLMVMGAYGHSRLREKLLGGVTRDMVNKAKVPLFLAR